MADGKGNAVSIDFGSGYGFTPLGTYDISDPNTSYFDKLDEFLYKKPLDKYSIYARGILPHIPDALKNFKLTGSDVHNTLTSHGVDKHIADNAAEVFDHRLMLMRAAHL